MNKIAIFLLVFIFIFPGVETFPGEKYIEKEILFAKWGDQAGEIPLYIKGERAKNFEPDKVIYSGPKLFKVDNSGNVYIMLIGYNSAIIKFNSNGSYITSYQYGFDAFTFSIDEGENLFVVAETDALAKLVLIKVFDRDGAFIEEAEIKWPITDIFYFDNSIYDLSGNCIYKYNKAKIKKPLKLEKNKFLIQKFNISPGYYNEKLKASPLIISGLENIGGEKEKKEIIAEQIKEYVIKDFKMIGISKKENIYGMIKITNAEHPGPILFAIIVIDKNGNIPALIPAKKYKLIELENEINNFVDIDYEGNIYQLWATEKGVYITKWIRMEVNEPWTPKKKITKLYFFLYFCFYA